MGIFDKLFRQNKSSERQTVQLATTPSVDPSKDPNLIKVYDNYGRELFITRQQWRDSILMDNLKKAWDKPDHLASLITQSLYDGFHEDMVKPARRLIEIDPNQERSFTLLGFVLLQLKKLDEAEHVLSQYTAKHGESGVILTNLAKVYAERDDAEKSIDTLWRGLRVDPNQDNGLAWYAAIHRDKGGEAAAQEAFRRVAAIPKSWRAQLWLAREALQRHDLIAAMKLYKDSLANAGEPAPADLLMQVSGDLGNNGYLAEILQLVAPRFNASIHEIQVGNNLMKAYVDLGRLDEAKRLLESLYAQNRPDWKQALNFWDTEIAKKHVSASPETSKTPLTMRMLTLDGPVWLRENSPAASLFSVNMPKAPLISFLGSSAELEHPSSTIQHQLSDAPGRMSRALPLFLAEQTYFNTRASVRTFIPWIATGSHGFVLCGVPWSNDDAIQYARQNSSDYLVIVHVKATAAPWQLRARLLRASDAAVLGQWEAPFSPLSPGDELLRLSGLMLNAFKEKTKIESQTSPSSYKVPAGNLFADYLLRLEQHLAVRCANMDNADGELLYGEREVLDGHLQLCLQQPDNLMFRVLLFQTLTAMKKCRPGIVASYGDKVKEFQRQYPLKDPARSIIDRIMKDILTP